MNFTHEQLTRYRRHLILPEIGVEGQRKLLRAKVLCVGVGGLGCPAALYLAAAGVGTIGLADVDIVSPSNLQRQILFDASDVGKDKVSVASAKLKALNGDVKIVEHRTVVQSSNVLELVRGYDIILDGTDNFPTRYCVNDACVIEKKPNIFGSIFRFDGTVSVFAPHLKNPDTSERGPCYRCLYAEPPDPGTVPSCAEGGVLGVLPGIVGSLQALETIKLISGVGRPAIGRLLAFSALDLEFRSFNVPRDPNCPVCGESPTITAPIDYEQFCGVPVQDPKSLEETRQDVAHHKGTMNKPMLNEKGLPPDYQFRPDWEITPREVKKKLDEKADFLLVDCRLPNEVQITTIASSTLIPLQQLGARVGELAPHKDREIVVYCRSGGRSLQFTQALRQNGFKNVRSMAGGILLWNKDVNPGGPQY
jgi:sulfur-carrier protein adenylyltransferase/sulfurtransferase